MKRVGHKGYIYIYSRKYIYIFIYFLLNKETQKVKSTKKIHEEGDTFLNPLDDYNQDNGKFGQGYEKLEPSFIVGRKVK